MRVTEVRNVKLDLAPLTDFGRVIYKTLLTSEARTTDELRFELAELDKGKVNLALAHLYRHDLIKVELEEEDELE